jgi:hypothetical protein
MVSDDPLNWVPTTLYTNLTLTNNTNVFEVNEGVAVTMTKDGKYAFVAGRNSKKIILGEDPLAGGNIGIIQYPLGPNPKLVAATEPVPGVLTNNVTLSGDGKYLIGSYPTLGGSGNAYVFDVEEIIKTVENPAYALKTRAVEKFNPNIIPKGAIPAVIAIGGNPLGLIAAAPDDPCLTLIEKIIALGKELKKRFDDLRLDDQDLYHRRREISNPPVPRIPPLSGRRTTVTGDPGSWDGHIEKYDKVQKELKKLLDDLEKMDNCDDYDPDGYGGSTMQDAYDQAVEYSQKQPPEEPDIRNRSSLLARANELGAQVRDGALWVAAGVGGAVLIALEVIARLLGLELRFRP